MVIQILSAFVISVAFGLLFGVQARNLPFAGLCGLASGAVYLLGAGPLGSLTAMVLASTAMALCSELLARLRRCPSTVFLIPGLIPLVPGGRIYAAMQLALAGSPQDAALAVYAMLLEAGALAVGILLVSSLFALRRRAKGLVR